MPSMPTSEYVRLDYTETGDRGESEVWPSSHAAAPNPKASSVIVSKAGHATNVERPKSFNSAMIGFIRHV